MSLLKEKGETVADECKVTKEEVEEVEETKTETKEESEDESEDE